MKSDAARVGLLLVLALTACNHNKNQALPQQPLAPPIEDTPPSKPDSAPANLPPPVITVPQPQQPATQAQQPPPPKPAPKHHKPKPAQDTTETAANNAPPAVSAEGTFSPAEPADMRKQTSDSIAETEKGLNGITRKLSDQEQKTSAQIREFLKQAKTALSGGDVDGAHTLALKAKVLLAELTTP
ncbi:MAG TPA: hypothetical protein VKB38_17590 [Terracidiphilus sp.]|nr:hypothetical protein [Terracidiphilus sp.]